MSIRDAYKKLCLNAKPAQAWYVSLYVRKPFYGGPQEGGWWSEDVVLLEYMLVNTEEEANVLLEAVQKEAVNKTEDARKAFGERCLRETEWLDARGLDDDFLPEVDGHEEYFVTVESMPGSKCEQGCRHYE